MIALHTIRFIIFQNSLAFKPYYAIIVSMINNISLPEGLKLEKTENGLTLTDGNLSMMGDFTKMLPRLKQSNLERELLVKAARIKNPDHRITVIDATAGMGEDSLLLAAAGFNVIMFEYDPVIAALLADSLERSAKITELAPIISRMKLINGSSINFLPEYKGLADVIFLDPMFPERSKSGLIKKKFQLLQKLEKPCDDELSLLQAAIKADPVKIIIKRPLKGPYLGSIKPDYSYTGKAIRVDVLTRSSMSGGITPRNSI